MDQINKENIDQWLFNNMEGDLSSAEIKELNDYLELNPAMLSAQDLWNEAHFKAIEIEEYPRLKAIQKGRSPWWKKAWFFFTITMLTGLLVLFYFTQYSQGEAKFDKTEGVRGTFAGKEVSTPPIVEAQPKQTIITAPVISQVAATFTPFKKKKRIPKIPKPPINDLNKPKINVPEEMPPKLEINQLGMISGPPADKLKPFKSPLNPDDAKRQAKKFKKTKRKMDRQRFDQNASHGHDAKIIPLESIGF
ncbi:MAG: hypothetical protein ACJASQ_002073 [Crocinitomicaceae bacterium]|jgi:hypothetical protein